MKFKDDLPIYIQIMDLIKIQIVNGEYKSGDKLLSVRDLASNLKVNPNTIQRAYQELELEEIVETKRGMGTFVKDDANLFSELKNDIAKNIISKFIIDIKPLGLSRDEIMNIVEKQISKEA